MAPQKKAQTDKRDAISRCPCFEIEPPSPPLPPASQGAHFDPKEGPNGSPFRILDKAEAPVLVTHRVCEMSQSRVHLDSHPRQSSSRQVQWSLEWQPSSVWFARNSCAKCCLGSKPPTHAAFHASMMQTAQRTSDGTSARLSRLERCPFECVLHLWALSRALAGITLWASCEFGCQPHVRVQLLSSSVGVYLLFFWLSRV